MNKTLTAIAFAVSLAFAPAYAAKPNTGAGNSGQGVGNTGPGNQGNSSSNGNAGGGSSNGGGNQGGGNNGQGNGPGGNGPPGNTGPGNQGNDGSNGNAGGGNRGGNGGSPNGDAPAKKEEKQKNHKANRGAEIGAAMAVAGFFIAVICTKENSDEANTGSLVWHLCRQGEMPDPFESYAQ